jgi:NADH-quinone oxidoreductase subunit L
MYPTTPLLMRILSIWVKAVAVYRDGSRFATAWLFYIRSPHLPRQLANEQGAMLPAQQMVF